MQECERDEDHHRGERGADHGRRELDSARGRSIRGVRSFVALAGDGLDHHDGIVDHEADRDRHPAERHEVQRLTRDPHRNEDDGERDRDGYPGHEAGTDVLQE